MANVNKVILIGRLTRDPEMQYTTGGMAICKFGMVTNETWKDKNTGEKKEEAAWHNCVAFAKAAETIGKYVTKGSELYMEGKIKYGKYTNKENREVKTTDIIVNQFQFLGGKKSMQVPGVSDTGAAPRSDDNGRDDDIPF